ncbi:hypothetical protein MASR2M78_16630 [Treponema sp.]
MESKAPKKMAAFLSLFRDYVFPSCCAVCSSPLLGIQEKYDCVCGDCAKALLIEEVPRCLYCGRPLISF